MTRPDTSAAPSEPIPDRDITVPVQLGARSYDIIVGHGLLSRSGELIKPVLNNDRVVIVTDENVAHHHLQQFQTGLTGAEIDHDVVVLPPGEGSKDWAILQSLLDQLLELRLGRQDMLVALGGGVIGDLVGFAAAILRRGVDFIQVPTSLLAQVDSSVGGKTAINVPQGKNLIGAFHQPRLVLADMAVLATLPVRELRAGYAEVVKYGLLGDLEFFTWLELNGSRVLAGEQEALTHAVATSCRAKADIVARDEREDDIRALLNLGHTFGHALEAVAGFSGSLLHGEAVAVGMVQAFEFSVAAGHCPATDVGRIRRHFEQLGLPCSASAAGLNHATPEELLHHMGQDKKVREGNLVFILVRGIGEAFIDHNVAPDQVLNFLKSTDL